jgi:NADPH:quinone reductase-like Zn-dependent oxidoreductase
VKAPSINPVDWKIREGKYPAVKSDKLPYVLGRDVSGVVEACGTETTGHQKGDEVYAMLGIDRGVYAEHVIVKANAAARKPRSIGHLAAAGVPLAGLTSKTAKALGLTVPMTLQVAVDEVIE